MSGPRALPPYAFLEAFPFHLWLDEALQVVQAGAVIQRVIPRLRVGEPAFASLRLLRPAANLEAAALRARRTQLFVLEAIASGMRLRGELIPIDDGSLILLLAPWITDGSDLERWGLSIADFPIHALMPDHLALLRSIRASLEDSRRMAARLEESQNRLASHRRQMPLAVVDWDIEGKVAAWNPAAERIFGVAAADAIGRGVEVLGIIRAPEHDLDEPFDLLTIEDQRVVTEHERDGSPVLCAWHNTTLVDVAGHPIGVSSIVRDVTESVQAERALRESQKFESLGLLAGGVAHDFNNLLAALLGNAELALAELDGGDQQAPLVGHLREIVTIAERAATLTRQLLDYSGRASYEMRPVDLGELLTQMRGLLATTLSKKVRLIVEGEAGLPSISADAAQLRQVVINLVLNASEAIGDRSGEIRLVTRVIELDEPRGGPMIRGGPLAAGAHVCFEVIDDGAGIDADTLPRIFDPFFSTKFTGRGLGLAAILGIVRGHGGALEVESEPNRGTRFALYFPAVEQVVARRFIASAELRRAAKGRLLVVDDEAQVRRMLALALGGAGFDVVAAAAGNTALELFDNDPNGFDLVLTDVTMPGLDGHELFRELLARDPELPVILSSGYTDQRSTARYPDGTPAAFIEKPYRLRHLLAKVTEELGKRGARC